MNKQLNSSRTLQNRRSWLKTLAFIGSGVVFPKLLRAASPKESRRAIPKGTRRSCRLAQITDVHVQPELKAGDGFVRCLHHLQGQKDAPQLILNTGDCIMDSMHATSPRTELQWNLGSSGKFRFSVG